MKDSSKYYLISIIVFILVYSYFTGHNTEKDLIDKYTVLVKEKSELLSKVIDTLNARSKKDNYYFHYSKAGAFTYFEYENQIENIILSDTINNEIYRKLPLNSNFMDVVVKNGLITFDFGDVDYHSNVYYLNDNYKEKIRSPFYIIDSNWCLTRRPR